jgi:hypothetical protein
LTVRVGRIRSVEGPENFVLKKNAEESLASLARASDTPDTIIQYKSIRASGEGGAAAGSGAVVDAGDRESCTAIGPLGSGGSASASVSASRRCGGEYPLKRAKVSIICDGTAVGRRVDPSHQDPERKRYHRFGAGLGRKDVPFAISICCNRDAVGIWKERFYIMILRLQCDLCNVVTVTML